MTTQEAIKRLEVLAASIEWEEPLDYQIALDMAIHALQLIGGDIGAAWHEIADDIYKCTSCRFEICATGCIDPDEYINIYKYCPQCGRKMEVRKRERH